MSKTKKELQAQLRNEKMDNIALTMLSRRLKAELDAKTAALAIEVAAVDRLAKRFEPWTDSTAAEWAEWARNPSKFAKSDQQGV